MNKEISNLQQFLGKKSAENFECEKLSSCTELKQLVYLIKTICRKTNEQKCQSHVFDFHKNNIST